MSFVYLVPALEEDIAHHLHSITILVLVSIGSVEVYAEANLTYTHLYNNRAYRSVYTGAYSKYIFPRPDSESKELSTILSRYPQRLLLASYRSADSRFRGYY